MDAYWSATTRIKEWIAVWPMSSSKLRRKGILHDSFVHPSEGLVVVERCVYLELVSGRRFATKPPYHYGHLNSADVLGKCRFELER